MADLAACEALLSLEADLLDRRRWEEWLALYTEDCVFWVPSWDTEEALVEDPELSVNTMYLVGKPALEARLHRIRSDDAYAAAPPARTVHSVTNARIVSARPGAVEVWAKWIVLSLEPRRGKSWRGGWYEYTLAPGGAGPRIARKKVVLMEDAIDGAIDIHQL